MKKILVVDDMAIFREPIATALRLSGYETLSAASGPEALELARSKRPDLILLDIAMPGMDGVTCLRTMRGEPALQHIPVIMLTAVAERDVVRRVVEAGVQGYLLKSHFSLDQLRAQVQKLLREDQPSPGGPPESAPPPASAPDQPGPKPEPRAAPPPLDRSVVLEHVRKESQLRAVPTVLHHVLALINNSRSSFEEVASAVRKDHALALKVMKVANSSLFGSGKPVQNIADAAQRVGMSGIGKAVAAILTIEHFDTASTGGLTPQRFWEHSLAAAVCADRIGERIGMKDAEHLFLAGLLHDIGRLVLGTAFPEHYQWVLDTAAEQDISLLGPEREVFGLGHDDVTKEILIQWGTPADLQEAAAAHELPLEQIRRTTRDPKSAIAVALADRLAYALVLGDSGNTRLLPIRDYAKALGLDGPAIRSLAREAIEKTQNTELFYASHTGQRFRDPLAVELAAKARGNVRLAVFATDAPNDPLSLFCEHLGWLDTVKPNLAILHAPSERVLDARFKELHRLEQGIGCTLGVLVVSPDASIAPPPSLLQERPWATARFPGRYDALILAIVKLRGRLATELSTAPA
jgi:putative nucleotidyltransferase with HDIG domain